MAILAMITVICNLINKCTKFSSHIYVSNIYFNEKYVQNVVVDANIGINNKMLVLLINRLKYFFILCLSQMDDNVSLDVEVGHVHYALHERAELCSHSYPDNVTEEHYLPGHPPSTRFRNYFCNATLSQEQI